MSKFRDCFQDRLLTILSIGGLMVGINYGILSYLPSSYFSTGGLMSEETNYPMLNYSQPSYEIIDADLNICKIKVTSLINPSSTSLPERKEILFNEAKKNSLCAMAFIQTLAMNGDEQALRLQALYQAYHRFFDMQDNSQLLKISQQILDDKKTDPLSHEIADYINNLLSGKPIDPSHYEARTLWNLLIPSFEETFSVVPPKKLYAEQLVKVPEMHASHNAFPDLIKYNGKYFATFREAASHVHYKDDGKIRILEGNFDTLSRRWNWTNVALLSKEGYDLRDPRFFIDENKELKIMVGASMINEEDTTVMMVPHVAEFKEGAWQLAEAVADPSAGGARGQWIWKVTWNPQDHCGYAFSYGNSSHVSLMKTCDGFKFDKIGEISFEDLTDYSEGTLRFKSDGTAIALIRTRKNGIIGVAHPQDEYRAWNWSKIPFRIGGPNFLISGNEDYMIAGTRHFFLNDDNTLDEATIIGLMDEKSLTPLIRLKSQFDSSYPGMVLEEDGSITVLYYSSDKDCKSNLFITNLLL